jgi:hypothetical protein
MAFWRALLITLIIVSQAHAQEQKTLGACSPAIADVHGNVSVTCMTGDRRIRIAKYVGSVDPDRGVALASFIEANCGQIIHLNAWTDGRSERYQQSERSKQTYNYISTDGAPSCIMTDCPGGLEINFDRGEKAQWVHGNWNFEGYYLVHCGSTYTGGVQSIFLRRVDDKEVLLSDKYDTK